MKYDANVLCNVFVSSLVFVVWDFVFLHVEISVCKFSLSGKF